MDSFFKEGGKSYPDVPRWVAAMIKLGYLWPQERSPWKRRICVISMPCDSVAAPLVSLGLLRKGLELESANEVAGHFRYLLRARDAFLADKDSNCGELLDAQGKKWVFSGGDAEKIIVEKSRRKGGGRKGKARFSEDYRRDPGRQYIFERSAEQWHLKGDPPVRSLKEGESLNPDHYASWPGCSGVIRQENLHLTYRGLMLVSRSEGIDAGYMQKLREVSFRFKGNLQSLDRLLTFSSSSKDVRRLDLCNYQKVKNSAKTFNTVITDGCNSFLKSVRHFASSDVIAVISRDESPDRLEEVSEQLSSMERYYASLSDDSLYVSMPSGIRLRLLQGR